MARKDKKEPPERGAQHLEEVSPATHDDIGAKKNVVGGVMLSSSLFLHPGGGGGRHVSDGDGEDGNKIRYTDFSSLKVPFPWRLWQLLEDSEKNGNQSIVTWLPDGDGFAVCKPHTFTNTIMKAYFALTTYDSFIQELLRYGFTQTTMHEDKLMRMDIFRNPRYNRKEKLKSLAIRRRSVTRSFSERMTAAAKQQEQQQQRPRENEEGNSCCMVSSDGDSQNIAMMLGSLASSQTQQIVPSPAGFKRHQTKIIATRATLYHNAAHGVVDEAINQGRPMDPPSSSSSLFSSNSEKCLGNDTDCDLSFLIDGCKDFQKTHDHSCSASIAPQYHQSVDGDTSFSTQDPLNLRMDQNPQERPVYQDDEQKSTGRLPIECYNGWIARTSDQDARSEQLRAWQLLEMSGIDGLRPESMLDDTPQFAHPSHFSTAYSQFSQSSDNVVTQSDLEKTLDEDIMESIFD